MTRTITYRLVFILSFVFTVSMYPQNGFKKSTNESNDHRVEDYLDLLKQGYSEIEIFQDLGNASFLAGNFETASFWYEKLLETNGYSSKELNYKGLYDFSRASMTKKTDLLKKMQWDRSIQLHYEGKTSNLGIAQNKEKPAGIDGKLSTLDGYIPSMSITTDGQTAYFSKASHQKPLYGVFSKKELIHEIYRAENIGGEWKNVTKVSVCPKYASAKHPTISADGKRLFFASNMKGSYGNYDIYVVDINKNGKLGVVKNLGPKVNTKEDELYPNLYNGTLLFFASSGRDGYGGLDLYATQVAKNSLTSSVNLGGHINSNSDDYSIALNIEKGTGYVVSNRGRNSTIEQYAVSYGKGAPENTAIANREDRLNTILTSETSMEYSTTTYDE